MTFTDEQIMAYVDGEIDLISARRIEKAMQEDSELAGRIAAQTGLRERIAGHFAPVADEPVPDQLASIIQNVDTSFARRQAGRFRSQSFGPVQWGAMAATLVIGLITGQVMQGGNSGLVAESGNMLVASGELESALDTQLASTQNPGASTLIGLTFRSSDGQICRTFESAIASGIACHANEEWQLRRTFEGTNNKQYRQASSGALNSAASSMMSGTPVDADGERALREKGWQ